MPTICFSFQGYMTTEITKAYDIQQGKDIDVSNLSPEMLVQELKLGKLAINLGDAHSNSEKSETELFDYEVAK